MRLNRSQTRQRRSHHAIKFLPLTKCPKCSAVRWKHRVCPNCGTYRGRQVIDVLAGLDRKAKKQKQAALAAGPKK